MDPVIDPLSPLRFLGFNLAFKLEGGLVLVGSLDVLLIDRFYPLHLILLPLISLGLVIRELYSGDQLLLLADGADVTLV
eukprot:CAMPEP_0170550712 /NCGR_PEP_ID=MMETSP0211-20121228/8718_1 /TAXON_ID=311385 /ORGANISM="Pseudokeronopsis sp., Strain OXSARD2" /LENGTH=78 /DNA_ID=CAMNT_0010857387 /DNA_START=457 /DNA_END=689 /DNA_ORIENTATION=+